MRSFTRSANLIRHQATNTPSNDLNMRKFSAVAQTSLYIRGFTWNKSHVSGPRVRVISSCAQILLLNIKMKTQTEELHYKYSIYDKIFHHGSAFLQHQTVHICEKYICSMSEKGLELSPLMHWKLYRCLY